MKSIRRKFSIITIICLTLSCLLIGGTGFIFLQDEIRQDSTQVMQLLCQRESQNINSMLSRIEQSVKTLSLYTLDSITDIERFRNDPAFAASIMKHLEAVAVNAANNTEGALTVYIRFNPELFSPTAGFFKNKSIGMKFLPSPPTDFSMYLPDDKERVGWYYIPIERKRPTWLDPYLNKNINTWIISYVIPLYVNGVPLGVVGMDINFQVLKDIVDKAKAYDTGYAFLVSNDSKIMYHREIASDTAIASGANDNINEMAAQLLAKGSMRYLFEYKFRGEIKRMAFRNLDNGLKIVLSAPAKEIDAPLMAYLSYIVVLSLLIMAFAYRLTARAVEKITTPLAELTMAAKKIALGDLGIVITHRSHDEMGKLADAFRSTVDHLKRHINYINGLAYRDALTGCKNKTAYLEAIQRVENLIHLQRPHFGVIVFDLNNLKTVNDTHGHDYGDILIISTAKIICQVFKRSPVYRIGGDEFVVLLENNDLEICHNLLQTFEISMQEWNTHARDNISLSVARGFALYEETLDMTYHSVFKRADEAMYKNKAEMKRKKTTED